MAVVGSLPNLISVPALRLHVLPEPDAVAPAATIATDHHSYDPSLYGPGAEHALLCRESSILLNCT